MKHSLMYKSIEIRQNARQNQQGEQRGARFDSRSTRHSSVGQLALLQNEEFEVLSHQRGMGEREGRRGVGARAREAWSDRVYAPHAC